MIEREPMRDAPAAIMPAQIEAADLQRIGDRDHVGRHPALAVGGMISSAGRLARVAIAPQIRQDQEEIVAQALRDAMPHRVRLGEAMQQHQRRAVASASDACGDLDAVHGNAPGVEAFEPGGGVRHDVISCSGARVRAVAACFKDTPQFCAHSGDAGPGRAAPNATWPEGTPG
jgi:hypothetical protein